MMGPQYSVQGEVRSPERIWTVSVHCQDLPAPPAAVFSVLSPLQASWTRWTLCVR